MLNMSAIVCAVAVALALVAILTPAEAHLVATRDQDAVEVPVPGLHAHGMHGAAAMRALQSRNNGARCRPHPPLGLPTQLSGAAKVLVNWILRSHYKAMTNLLPPADSCGTSRVVAAV